MKAAAKKDGDDFVINANKLWITNSGHAGLFLVFANAKPELIKENPKEVYVYFKIKCFEWLDNYVGCVEIVIYCSRQTVNHLTAGVH